MEGGEPDASSGGSSWCPVRVFPPRPSSSSSVDANASLANGLSQMALVASAADSPRPKKIRRRNAITVLDSSHLPLLHNTLGDSFESASLLQSLEDGVAAAGAVAPSSPDAMPAPLQYHRNPTAAPPGAKRKVPKARLKSNSSTSFKKHRQKDADIHSIRLHQDLTSHAPKNEILPESILKCYRDQYQNSLAEMAASAAETVAAAAAATVTPVPPSPCNALVLYTPPEKTIHEVLNTVRKNEVKQQISNCVKKQRSDTTMEIDA